ncbi:PTS sugar transporter subunit IIA [Latilactobacillus sakei]
MRQLILVSHGDLTKSYLTSLDMIAGGHDNVTAITFDGEISKTLLGDQIEVALNPDAQEVIIVVNLPGGTPCNVVLERYLTDERITILASLNLPMILELYLNLGQADYQMTQAIKTAISNTYDVKQQLSNQTEDDE